MRRSWFLLPLLICASAPALAQVTVDLHALDALPGGSTQTPTQAPAETHRLPEPKRVTAAKPKTPPPEQATATAVPVPPTPPTAASPAQPAAPPANLPAGPPPIVALAPIEPPAPSAAPAAPPTPPVSATADSAALPKGNGLRVTFGSGQSDLSPASVAAIESLVKTAPSSDSTSFNVVAYAAGTPADPSTARRLSLSRALAVRSALMADGVGSSRIYVRAMGAGTDDQTPDRVDVAVLGGNAPSDSKSAQQ